MLARIILFLALVFIGTPALAQNVFNPDFAFGATQGMVLYRSATQWIGLPPGTSGQLLQSGGAAANPSWATISTGTITANSSATSGFSAGQLVYSDGAKIQATAALYDATKGFIVGATQGYWTSGRGGITQGADGVFTFQNNAGTNTFNLSATGSATGTFTGRFTFSNGVVTGSGSDVDITVIGLHTSNGGSVAWGAGSSGLTLSKSGNGIGQVGVNGNNANGQLNMAGVLFTAAAPTVAAAQIGLGSTVAANTNCGALALSAGCMVINVAGTTQYIPYY